MKRKAAERVAQAKAMAVASRELVKAGVVPVDDPVQELRALAGRARTFLDVVEAQFARTGDLTWAAATRAGIDEFRKTLEAVARVLPAQQVQRSDFDDATFDQQVEALLEGVRRTRQEFEVCPSCGQACPTCGEGVPTGIPRPKPGPLELEPPIPDAVVVPDVQSEPVISPSPPLKPSVRPIRRVRDAEAVQPNGTGNDGLRSGAQW